MRRLGKKSLKIISVLSVCGKKTSCEINLSKITFRYGNEHNINFWYFLYKFLQLEVFSLILTRKKNMTLLKCYLRLWTLETHWSLALSPASGKDWLIFKEFHDAFFVLWSQFTRTYTQSHSPPCYKAGWWQYFETILPSVESLGGGAAGGLWRHQTWSPSSPPSGILSSIRNRVKTGRINHFLRLTCK